MKSAEVPPPPRQGVQLVLFFQPSFTQDLRSGLKALSLNLQDPFPSVSSFFFPFFFITETPLNSSFMPPYRAQVFNLISHLRPA